MNVFQHAHFAPNISIQANDIQTIIELVASEMGITITPSPINETARIILRKIEDIDVSIQVTIAWGHDNYSEFLANFLDFFKEYYKSEMS